VILAMVLIVALGVAAWLWRGDRDPLIYLVPVALTFPPLIAYGGRVLGWPGTWLSTRVALVLGLGLFVVFRVLRRDFSWHRIPGVWFVAPYCVLVTASVLWSVLGPFNGEASDIAGEFLSWVILASVFVCIASSSHKQADLRGGVVVLLVVGFGACLYAALQALVLTGNTRFVPQPIIDLTEYAREDLPYGALRLHGTLPNLGPNFFGAFLLWPTVLGFSGVFSRRGLARWACLLIGLAGAAVIAATYSRGALLGLAVALLVLPVWRRSVREFAAIAGAIALMGIGIAQTPIGRNAALLYASGQLDVSAQARVYLWRAISNSVADHPLGLGFDGWPRASRSNMEVGLADPAASIGTAHAAENQWMRELADRGIPGVLTLALLMIGLMHFTYRSADPRRSQGQSRDFLAACGATCAGWSVAFLTGDQLAYDNTAGIFWYMIALALATARPVPAPPRDQAT
jgi:hypothetical protein